METLILQVWLLKFKTVKKTDEKKFRRSFFKKISWLIRHFSYCII